MTSAEDGNDYDDPFWYNPENEMSVESLDRRVDLMEELQEVEEEVNQVLSRSWERETSWGDTWWDVENQYEGSSGTISVKGRADGKITLQYRTDYSSAIPGKIEEQLNQLNTGELSLQMDQVSKARYEPRSISFNIELDEEIEDHTPEQRYLRDTVGLMAAADRLIPETREIVPYKNTED